MHRLAIEILNRVTPTQLNLAALSASQARRESPANPEERI
jgi:hypothetical protein